MNLEEDRLASAKRIAQQTRGRPRVWIGTSGWHYRHWRGPVYPEDLPARRYLAFYAKAFGTVEVNNSFYHLLPPDAVSDWRGQVPPGFLFAAKGSRFITHMRKLKEPKEPLRRYFERMKGFGAGLGPIVFQLPPKWRFNAERLQAFFKALPRGRRYAFEFRDPSWLTPAAYEILAAANAAFCIYHLAGFQSPLAVTADFVYVRLHGPGGKYQASYAERDLQAWADRFRRWNKEGRDVYCYFDNDQAGYAFHNARRLKEIVRA